MFAATLTGSPVENACRVIADHEGDGRGHYGAVLARFERTEDHVDLDAPILIRTAYLSAAEGHLRVRIPVGATLVRHSVPEHEVAETHAKVATLVRAFEPDAAATGSGTTAAAGPALMADPDVQALLAARNRDLAPFWLRPQRPEPVSALAGRRVLLVDAEDEWTAMLAHLCRHLGLSADVRRWDVVRPSELDRADLVVAGPGPGDPRHRDGGRLDRLRTLVEDRLESSAPTLAVCLSHQLLAARLGFPLAPLPSPHQGTQRHLDLLGRRVRVGFYNTFSAWTRPDRPDPVGRFDVGTPSLPGAHGWAVPGTGEVLALRVPSARAASVQCHLESVLSPDGAALMSELLTGLLADRPG